LLKNDKAHETVSERIKTRMTRNPLVHIVLFGVLLAGVLLILRGPPASREEVRQVVITDSDVEQVRGAWRRTWKREPTQMELRGQLEQFIREEVLYREALARGFDRDDTIVRRTMQRKMEFLAEGQVLGEEPTEDEIRAYYAFRRERYRVPPRVSFMHIYFSTDKRGGSAGGDVVDALARLKGQRPELAQLSEFGDRFMLNNHYVAQTERELRALFGEGFAREVMRFETDDWQGPVESGYGLHAVYVYKREDSYIPEWTQIRDDILDDMVFEAKKVAKERFYQEILRQYEVIYQGQARKLLEAKD
jgi:hypothetical protein